MKSDPWVHQLVTFQLVAVLTLTWVTPGVSWAERAIISADADASVTKVRGDNNRGDAEVLSAGVTQSPGRGPSRAYIGFDLRQLPEGSLINDLVIESAHLRLFAQSTGLVGADDRRFLVTVADCEGAWEEETITWDNQPCFAPRGVDSLVINGEELPAVYKWDVTTSIANALAKNRRASFVVDALSIRVQLGTRDILTPDGNGLAAYDGEVSDAELRPGFLRIWSRERTNFGSSAVPTLLVSYTLVPTALARTGSMFLSILSALGVALGTFQAFRAITKRH